MPLQSYSPKDKDIPSPHTHSVNASNTTKFAFNPQPVQNTQPTVDSNVCGINYHKLLKLHRKNTLVNIVSSRGYKKQETIATTLQGEVFIAAKTSLHRDSLLVYGYIRIYSPLAIVSELMNICYDYIENEKSVVIKTANKKLYGKGITISDTGAYKIMEDIVKEAYLMKVFRQHNPPKSMIKYYDFFEDEANYYLVMEQGGEGLFEFVVQCHALILNGELSITEWKKTVRFIFSKMVDVVHWMHNAVYCCNLDISLENVVMGKYTHFDAKSGKIKNLEIRFIDFGLTEMFDSRNNCDFICNKFVGKSGYKAPKIFKHQSFYANKADIWSLGMSLFMMSIGAPLYNHPITSDRGFRILSDGKIILLLKSWSRLSYIGKNQYDLLMKMLCVDEEKRYSIHDIIKHEWIKSYFKDETKLMQRKLHSKVIKNNYKKQTPSIKESETFVFEHNECCAAVMMDDDYK